MSTEWMQEITDTELLVKDKQIGTQENTLLFETSDDDDAELVQLADAIEKQYIENKNKNVTKLTDKTEMTVDELLAYLFS